MDDQIMVSVIVLTYNHEKYIRQALDSILMQEVDFRYEILVGDDASVDHTPEILKEYQKKHPDIFHLYLRTQNLGATRNSYELLTSCRGVFIAACEGDDYWTDSLKLKKQVEFLRDHPEFIGCSHDCKIVDELGRPARKQALPWVSNKKVFTLNDFKGKMLPGQAATIVRRNIYCNQRCDYSIFYRAHPQIGDRTTILCYAAQGKFYHMPVIMSCYRRSNAGKGLSSGVFSKRSESLLEDLEFTEKLENFAINELNVNAGFDYHKKDLFVSSIYYYLLGEKENAQLAMIRILRKTQNPIKLLIYVPFGVVKKMFHKIIYY